jgi:hypothetical protein
LIVLLMTGCSSSQSPAPRTEPASGIGLVSGVFGLELSDGPAGPTTRTAASDLALVTHTQQTGSVTWTRLVVADGSSGWTSRALNGARAVRVRPSARPFFLLNKSPDDADFGEAAEIPVDADSEGQIVGASRRGRIAGDQELMLPEKYRHALPWLELKFGSKQGFAPFDWIALLPTPAPQVRTLEEGLDALKAKGLVWKPFLGALLTSPFTHVTPGTAFELEDPSSSPRKTDAAGEWSRLEFVFRDEQGLMAVYADGPRRLFRFIQGARPPANIVLSGDSAVPAKTRHRDLNADGMPEWIVEIAARYGDGFYAVLWVVDGRSVADSLKLQHLSLSQSAGESPSTGVDASWELRDDGTIQVTRETAGKRRATVYRYTDRLIEVH